MVNNQYYNSPGEQQPPQKKTINFDFTPIIQQLLALVKFFFSDNPLKMINVQLNWLTTVIIVGLNLFILPISFGRLYFQGFFTVLLKLILTLGFVYLMHILFREKSNFFQILSFIGTLAFVNFIFNIVYLIFLPLKIQFFSLFPSLGNYAFIIFLFFYFRQRFEHHKNLAFWITILFNVLWYILQPALKLF